MRIGILCSVILAFVPAARGQSINPTLPDATWVVIPPATVEVGQDWTNYGDVYAGAGSNWESSPIVLAYPTLDSYSPKTYSDLLDQIQVLRDRLSASSHFTGSNGPRVQRELLQEVDVLLGKARGLEQGERQLTFQDVKDLVDDRFLRVDGRWPGQSVAGGTFDVFTNSAFFPTRTTQVVLRADKRPVGALAGLTPHAYYATIAEAIEFRAVCARVQKIFTSFMLPKLKDTHLKLSQINDRWDRYLGNGYSQYPWELLLNSYRHNYTWMAPPETQWVLAHPDVGFVVDVRSTRSAQLEPALLLHGIGHLWYFDDHKWYGGASLTAAITGNSEFGLGYGATLHFGHASLAKTIPQISLSVLWHDYEQGSDGYAIGLNFDLGSWIADNGEELFRGRLAVRQPNVRVR